MRPDNPGRYLSIWTSTSFIISSMIGTGVFTSLGYQLLNIQSIFPLLLLWVIGGIIAFCGAVTYAELGSLYPRSGGEYYLLGRMIHPSIGFGAGLVSATVGFTAPTVLASIALGNYLSAIIPEINGIVVAISVILFFHAMHMSSITLGTFFQNIGTGIKILFILIFIGFGLSMEIPQKISVLPVSGDLNIIFGAKFAVSLVWVSYAYTGWNSIIYVASDVRNPERNISKSMLIATGMVMTLYLLLNYIFLYSTPISLLTGKIEVAFFSGIQIFGNVGGEIISIGISILLLSTISSYIFIGPRIVQVIGEDHELLSIFKKKNKNNIPINAFFFQLILSILLILTSSFEQVLMYTGVCLILTSSLTVLALFISRFKDLKSKRPYKTWGYPFTPVIYLFLNMWILFYSIKESPFESIIGMAIFILSVGIYFIINKKYITSR